MKEKKSHGNMYGRNTGEEENGRDELARGSIQNIGGRSKRGGMDEEIAGNEERRGKVGKNRKESVEGGRERGRVKESKEGKRKSRY